MAHRFKRRSPAPARSRRPIRPCLAAPTPPRSRCSSSSTTTRSRHMRATSRAAGHEPEVTGRSLKANQSAVDAYRRHVAARRRGHAQAIEAAVPQSTTLESFQVAYGGVTAIVPANTVGDLLDVDGVVAVQKDSLEQPLTDATPDFIGATDVWPRSAARRPPARASSSACSTRASGRSTRRSRTTASPTRPGGPSDASSETAPIRCSARHSRATTSSSARTRSSTHTSWRASRSPGEFCNNATGNAPRATPNGHGTHTSSTAAGSHVDAGAALRSRPRPDQRHRPGRPRDHLPRLWRHRGCFQSDSVAAVEQAIDDEVDVINFSISGGANAYTDAVELAFLDAFAAGILRQRVGRKRRTRTGNRGPRGPVDEHRRRVDVGPPLPHSR